MSQEEELETLRACLAGEAGAWEAFVDRWGGPLGEVCRRTLRRCGRPSGPQEVTDMLQEVFLALIKDDQRSLRAYRGQGSLGAYLHAVAVFRVLNDRSLAWRGELPNEERSGPPPSPDQAMMREEALGLLKQGMEILPSRERLALALQGDGASLREIGESLGISPEAAGQLLYRSRAKIREFLLKHGA